MAFTTTVGAGGTSLIGTSGVDSTTFAPSTLAPTVFVGAQGDTDFVTITASASGYTVRGGAGADTINAAGFSKSLVTGDDGDDKITITGTIQSSTVSGLEGADTIAVASINGGTVNGNNGNDKLSIADGSLTNNGKLVGGQGNDTFTFGAGVILSSGIVNGQDGDDTITISNVAAMASTGATIFGGQGSDTISAAGNAGNAVVISGDLGADNLTGSGGKDTIFGGDGNDRITGGGGADSMIGGSGVDTFIQSGNPSNLPAFTPTTLINALGFDVISGFEFGLNGDIVSGLGSGAVAPVNYTTAAAVPGATISNSTVYSFSGTYNAGTGTFTYVANNSGADTLLVATDAFAGTFAAPVFVANATVLQSVNITTLTASNFA